MKIEPGIDLNIDLLKKAYYKQSKELHPDLNPDIDTTQSFARLQTAYEHAIEHVQNAEMSKIKRKAIQSVRPVTMRRGFGARNMDAQFGTTKSKEEQKKTVIKTWVLEILFANRDLSF